MPHGISQCYSVICQPAEVTFPPLPQPKLVLDLATLEGCKAELTWLACYTPRWYTRPKSVTHPGTNRARPEPALGIGKLGSRLGPPTGGGLAQES